MTYLGDGVHEDGPIGPICPICPSDKPVRVEPNTGAAGGWLCGTCGFVFDGNDREKLHPRTQRRRTMWAAESGAAHQPEPLSPEAKHHLAEARQALRDATASEGT